MSACWIDGKLVEPQQATVSVFDHGLLYGDGVFEGIRFYSRVPFRLETHLRRLKYSARVLGINLTYSNEQLIQAIDNVIEASGQTEGYLRLVITRGKGPLGIDPRSCERCTVIIIADQLNVVAPQVLEQGARLIIAATRRLPPDGLDPRIKSLNYLNHIFARMEANHAGADEAILLNTHGHVTEGTTDNVFIVRQGKLFTPPISDGALEGVTREVVIELAESLGISCKEKTLAPYDLYTCDECFLTGTAVELVPVKEIDARVLPDCPGPVFRQLQVAFRHHIGREQVQASVAQAAS